ncbi:MAG: 4Fe-4S binding protein [Clostridia bacterium]|nr:4Fe-4S binding protein [Clostridia bacterium]
MNKILQLIIQFTFLVLFIILTLIGKVHLWMGLFAMGVIASIWFGRIYCGWICPINTAMGFITFIKTRLHIKSTTIPSYLSRTLVRYIALTVFIAVFLFTVVTGRQLPVLPILLISGVLITLIFPSELWHYSLCPFGTILAFSSRLSRHYMRINSDKCIHCGLCFQVCPAKAVNKKEGSYRIIKNDCLVCMNCSRKCPKNAITYQ